METSAVHSDTLHQYKIKESTQSAYKDTKQKNKRKVALKSLSGVEKQTEDQANAQQVTRTRGATYKHNVLQVKLAVPSPSAVPFPVNGPTGARRPGASAVTRSALPRDARDARANEEPERFVRTVRVLQKPSHVSNLSQQTGLSPLARHVEKVSAGCGF